MDQPLLPQPKGCFPPAGVGSLLWSKTCQLSCNPIRADVCPGGKNGDSEMAQSLTLSQSQTGHMLPLFAAQNMIRLVRRIHWPNNKEPTKFVCPVLLLRFVNHFQQNVCSASVDHHWNQTAQPLSHGCIRNLARVCPAFLKL